MIESVLHLFKIHRKVVFGNTAIIVQRVFGVTPKSFNAVNVVLRLPVDQVFRMINPMVFTPTFQGIVTPESVGEVH